MALELLEVTLIVQVQNCCCGKPLITIVFFAFFVLKGAPCGKDVPPPWVTVIASILMLAVFWRIAIPQDFVQFFDGNYMMQMQTIRDKLIYLPTFGIAQVLYDLLFTANTLAKVGVAA